MSNVNGVEGPVDTVRATDGARVMGERGGGEREGRDGDGRLRPRKWMARWRMNVVPICRKRVCDATLRADASRWGWMSSIRINHDSCHPAYLQSLQRQESWDYTRVDGKKETVAMDMEMQS
jgi:hypothetical protein